MFFLDKFFIVSHSDLSVTGALEGPIAQLEEPPAHNRSVPGSNPGGPTMLHTVMFLDFKKHDPRSGKYTVRKGVSAEGMPFTFSSGPSPSPARYKGKEPWRRP